MILGKRKRVGSIINWKAQIRIRLGIVELRYRGGKLGSRKGKRGKQKGKDMESISFSGHMVSSEGIRVDLKKIEAITDWLRPTTATEVQSFIGLASYYRHFV